MESGQPRLIKGLQADYVPATYPGRNTAGFKSFGKNIVVLVDTCSTASAGGVLLTDEMVDRMTANATTGCIFYIGAEAFRHFDDGTPWVGDKPKVGDRVFFEKYAGGQIHRGIDGRDYRIMDYRCLAGAVDEDNPDVVAWEAQQPDEAAAGDEQAAA